MKTLLVVAVVAVGGYFLWSHYFSHAGRIERAYQACLTKMNAGMDNAKIDVKTPNGSDPASAALAKDMTSALMQGMGGAVCGMIKQTCREDFNGPICQAAMNSR